MKTYVQFLDSAIGPLKIKASHTGVSSITLGAEKNEEVAENAILQQAVKQLTEYFAHERKSFTVQLDVEGTEFQKRVWGCLLQIPFGKTISYIDLARRLGDEKAIRAVAAANAKNPAGIIIPCHRVISANGSLTGYAGGLGRKQWLLNHEAGLAELMLGFCDSIS